MSDRLPGTSWDNPIWHRGFRVYLNDEWPTQRFRWTFQHDDYDGSEDSGDGRYGFAASEADARAAIDELLDLELERVFAIESEVSRANQFGQFLQYLETPRDGSDEPNKRLPSDQ